jgi:hypothetical protein
VIRQGDDWLRTEIPAIMSSAAYRNNGVILITWDEDAYSSVPAPIGMIALSPLAKGHGYVSSVYYDHSSTVKSLEEIFGVGPFLGGAGSAGTNDLRDLFVSFP